MGFSSCVWGVRVHVWDEGMTNAGGYSHFSYMLFYFNLQMHLCIINIINKIISWEKCLDNIKAKHTSQHKHCIRCVIHLHTSTFWSFSRNMKVFINSFYNTSINCKMKYIDNYKGIDI